jgi:thymidylate kinase
VPGSKRAGIKQGLSTPVLERAHPWIVVTGLDGSGKSGLVRRLSQEFGAHSFRLPFHAFVKDGLRRSGDGTPFGDVYTDRLIMAADARLANYRIRDWRRRYALLVSQRAWMDNFVFGAVQGWSYAETDALLRTAELERPSAAIFLVAEPEIAFQRICSDPDADKFETLEFMRDQCRETLRFYGALESSDPDLSAFCDIPAQLCDTSRLSEEAVFRTAERFLRQRGLCGTRSNCLGGKKGRQSPRSISQRGESLKRSDAEASWSRTRSERCRRVRKNSVGAAAPLGRPRLQAFEGRGT